MSQDRIADQILRGSEKGKKTYGFDDGHDPSKPAQMWFQDSTEGRVLFIVFYTQACRWSRCLGCNLPSLMSTGHVPFDAIMAQVDHLFSLPEVLAEKDVIQKVIVSNNGSVLDEATFSSTALLYLIARFNQHFNHLKKLSFETRPEYVDFEELTFLSRALAEGRTKTGLELCIGFEAFDDHIRNQVFDKGLELDAFQRLVDKIAPFGFSLKCYFMQKPVPEMTDEQALEDVMRGMDFMAGAAKKSGVAINMHLNPTYAARGTELEAAFLEGRFTPPRLADVARAVAHARGKDLSVFVGLSDEGLACEGGSFVRPGDEGLIRSLERFNQTQDFSLINGV